jgi:N-acetylmuramoyl-L-alanine amidase
MQSTPPPHPAANPPPTAASTLILLDPAHGGPDTGAALGGSASEKDVTLALAGCIRGTLASSGFTVISTRDGDPSDALTADQRAEAANRTHPLACIVLHATATGSGVHIFTSALQPPIVDASASDPAAPYLPVPWESAQTKFIPQSISLASALTASLQQSHLPARSEHAPIRPLDNMMCPAIAIELAPLPSSGSAATLPTDESYQQQVAAALTNALRQWRDQNRVATTANTAASPADLDSQIAAQSRAIAAAEAAGRAAARPRPSTTSAAPKGQP